MSTDALVTCWEVPEGLFGKPNVSHKMLNVECDSKSLKYTLLPDPVESGTSEIPGGAKSIADLLQKYADFLYGLSKGLSEGRYVKDEDRESVWINLRALGSSLFQYLLPPELQDEIRSWPDRTVLLVSTNEKWVPWELMHDGKGFLAQRMLLVRMPRYSLKNWTGRKKLCAGRPALPESGDGRRVLNVVGGDLRQHLEDCQRLFQCFGSEVELLMLNEKPLSLLTKEIKDADLVHITCHGYHDPLMLRIHETNDLALNLLVDSVAGDDFHIKPRCLIYANSCSSAAGEFSREEFVGFGWEFYTKGAAAYIGTLGTVPTSEALAFAQGFYSRLASGQTKSIYSAYQATREEAISKGPACLLFCIYGNYRDEPSFKLPRREGLSGTGCVEPSA